MSARPEDITPSNISLDAIDHAVQQAFVAHEVEKTRVNRLLAVTFMDALKAEHGLKACLRGFGVEATFKILDDRGLLPRSHYFGFLNGSLFARGDKARAKDALRELPEAIRDREVLARKLGDLINVRRSLLEQAADRSTGREDRGRDDDVRERLR